MSILNKKLHNNQNAGQDLRYTGPARGECPLCRAAVVFIVDNLTRRTETCEGDMIVYMTVQGRKLGGYAVHVCKPTSAS